MIFEKSHYDSRRSGENRPSGDRDGAPRNALYARKTSLCTSQPRRTKLAGTVYAEGLFAAAAQESARAWQTLWQQANITVTGDLMSQKLLRIHSYHLLASASPFSNQAQALDVSITARGLHGEAYRGHIFWDEIFILPFYIQHYPDTAKQLLLYRYHRLEGEGKCGGQPVSWRNVSVAIRA